MPIKILMPALSPTMTHGNLARWIKNEGDKVKAGDLIAEIETDKAIMEIESVDDGTIAKILIAAGTENVEINSLICILLEEGENEEDLALCLSSMNDNIKPIKVQENTQTIIKNDNNVNIEILPNDHKRIFISPLAKRISEQHSVDITNIKGSGPYGRIIKSDILSYKKPIDHSIENRSDFKIEPLSNMRKIIASRLLESKQTIPHFYLSIDCNVDKLLQMRAELNYSLATSFTNHKISVNDFIILATAKSLYNVPRANASWQETGVCYYNNVDISVAVAVDSGLITPVLHKANEKTILSLSYDMKTLISKARENKLLPHEFQGGGFTISNLGMYGISSFSAIINPPQACILAVGASIKKPVVIDYKIEIATIMNVTLSCDHRIVDGAVGAEFLSQFKKYIEKPLSMLL